MSADIELLRRATAAYNRGDLDALRELYAADITAKAGELWPSAGQVQGVERVLSEFASMFATFERVEVVAEDYIERGQAVVVPSRWRGTVSGSDSVIEQLVVAVYRVRAGRVASIEYFGGLDAGLAAAES
jgi:ketosteroid isomerase-like protein